MHYKNGREAKNGDKVVMIQSPGIVTAGILYNAMPGNDHCNGRLALMQQNDPYCNLKECLHADDIAAATIPPPAAPAAS
jgi:hypothetical protein